MGPIVPHYFLLNILERFADMIFDSLDLDEILRSMEAETAKALNELRCAQRDLKQIEARTSFMLSAIHALKERVNGLDKEI